MPRFNNEKELLEKFCDDVKNFNLWSELVNGRLRNSHYEIINGMVILIPYYNRKFALLSTELAYQFHRKNANYELFIYLSNFDVKIDDNNIYMPKGVIYDPAKESSNAFVTNPIVVFEILTEKNKYLLNAKFEHYQGIESFQEYVLLDLNTPQVWVYRKSNDWQAENFTLEQSFKLESIDYMVKVADIYDNVDLK